MENKKKFNWFHKKKHHNNKPQGNQPAHTGPAAASNSAPATAGHHPHPHHDPHARSKFGGALSGKKMRIIPLGGLEEVGKNIMALEYENDIVIIDAGMSFAGPDMLGVDFIVPDISYLEAKKRNVRGILFTHGHLDHIGAIQYVLPKLGNPPIYGSKLTLGLVKDRLKEFALDKSAHLNVVDETKKIKLGAFDVEFFRVNHSIPDSMGIYIKSPAGSAVHTGDFKFDHSPAIDKPVDFQRIAAIGSKGIDVLMIDSTNALRPGFCKSEAEVAATLERIIEKTKGRIIMACFSSLIGRVNQVVHFAAQHNRKVYLAGRSMINNVQLAEDLGYASYPKGTVRKIGPQVNSLPPNQVMILTTGAQGESLSALTRMSIGEHSQIKIREGDTVVISASPIPGNELAIVNVVNNLYAQGATVITNNDMDIHVSGHAHQEELKLMYGLIKPKCYVPIHGELYMRRGHIEMIKTVADPGMMATCLDNNGDVLEVSPQGIRKSKEKVSANDILVDGLGFGDIGSRVIQDRKVMSMDGVLVMLFHAYGDSKRLISEPDIISRGFLYLKESDEVAQETKKIAQKAFETITQQNKNIDLKDLKQELIVNISSFIRKRLGREPMIIPIINYN
jgi:ribonuclease J